MTPLIDDQAKLTLARRTAAYRTNVVSLKIESIGM